MDYSNSSFHELNISFCEIDVDEISLDMNDNSLDFGNVSFIENVDDTRETFISTPPRWTRMEDEGLVEKSCTKIHYTDLEISSTFIQTYRL